jgi:hypothetical protein
MLRFARLLAAALTLTPVAFALHAQSAPATSSPGTAGPAGTPAEPTLERRVLPTAGGPSGRSPAGAVAPDPWLVSYVGLSGRTARINIAQLDRALEPYRATYTRLPAEERARIRQSFDDVVPLERFDRYRVSAPQARAIVYLALGPSEWLARDRDCGDRPRRRGGPTRCGQAIDSMSRQAAWIHSTILAMGRSGNRRPRAEELGALRQMNEDAREMLLSAAACGCPAARTDAEALLTGTRDAVDAYEGSSMPAWMSLGDQRVQRISRLSDSLERTFIRCLGEG